MYICIVRVSIRVLTDIRTSINIIGLIAKLNEKSNENVDETYKEIV